MAESLTIESMERDGKTIRAYFPDGSFSTFGDDGVLNEFIDRDSLKDTLLREALRDIRADDPDFSNLDTVRDQTYDQGEVTKRP